ncbi:AMP-binding protein [Saccharicrinis sp. FJH54]|uniref:AMP-binding protein n=1 Tax=Saccharicrinis sp. FJH54 TaxID=3344665 RepID=UPI0035D4CE23
MLANNYFTFAEIIPDVTSRFKNNRALGFIDDDAMTFAELGGRINAVMAFLEELGLKPGDKSIILSQNMPNWGIAYLAMLCMGIVAVPVLPEFTEEEVLNVLLHSEAETVFVSKNLESKIKNTAASKIRTVIRIEDFSVLRHNAMMEFNKNGNPVKQYKTNKDDLAVLIYTSGTTGNSKGVMLSQKNIISNVIQSSGVQDIEENDRFLSVLPLSHTYENTIGFLLPLLSGASVTYLRKPPTPAILVPAMKKVRPTLMLTVPLIIEKIFRNKVLPELEGKTVTRVLYKFPPTRKLLHRVAGKKLMQTFGGQLKFFGIGGAKLDGTVEHFLREARFPYAIGYGLTETSPLLAGSNPTNTKFQAIGPVVENCEIKINEPDSRTGEGEIWAKGPNVMLGYYKNQEETEKVLTTDGWFKTGDLGVFDRQGWLSHKGRLKNVLVGANGENIYPEEIESVINNFKHVLESIVVQKKGKLVAMVHFNREEVELKLQEVKHNLSQRLDDTIIGDLSKHVDEKIEELARELKEHINARVNKFSKIQNLIIQSDPFKKTATKKIKRYLYT